MASNPGHGMATMERSRQMISLFFISFPKGHAKPGIIATHPLTGPDSITVNGATSLCVCGQHSGKKAFPYLEAAGWPERNHALGQPLPLKAGFYLYPSCYDAESVVFLLQRRRL